MKPYPTPSPADPRSMLPLLLCGLLGLVNNKSVTQIFLMVFAEAHSAVILGTATLALVREMSVGAGNKGQVGAQVFLADSIATEAGTHISGPVSLGCGSCT